MKSSPVRLFAQFVLGIVLGSCKLLPLEEMPEPPPGWQISSAQSNSEFGCPTVEGAYTSTSEALKFVGLGWEPIDSSETRHYHLFIGPADFRGLLKAESEFSESMRRASEDSGWIRFEFPQMERLVFQYPVPDKGLVMEASWSRSLEQFSCANGQINFPIDVDLRGGDGPDGNSQSQVSMGLSKDGSLIVYERISLAKPSLLDRGFPKFWVYRFEPLP